MKQKLPVKNYLFQAVLIVLGVVLSHGGFAQLTETFNTTSLPAGWSNTNNWGTSSANGFWKFSGNPDYAMNPTNDHTGNGGRYAWVDGSFPNGAGRIVRLESPGIAANTLLNPELKFWLKRRTTGYSINPMNEFTVDLYNGTAWQNAIFTHTTQTVNGAWEEITVNLATYTLTGNIKVRFNVEKKGSPAYYDDIAIDDIRVKNVANNDVSPSALITPALPACVIDTNVKVELTNMGINTLTNVKFALSLNGVAQTPTTWTGSLATNAKDTVTLTSLPTLNFGDTIQIRTYDMNSGATDQIAANDTLTVIYKKGLSGTYTLGTAASNDYNTFAQFMAAVEEYGLCGPVVVNVMDGTYNEQIEINEYSTSNSTNTVTFKSNSGNAAAVVISSSGTSASNYTVKFKKARYFNFENLTIENLGSSYSRAVVYEDKAHHNGLKKCILTSPTSTSSWNNNRSVVYANSEDLDSNMIVENTINNGTYGVYYRGSSNNYNKGFVMKGNKFMNQYHYGSYVYYAERANLSDNYYLTNSTYSSSYAMYNYYCFEVKINDNYIDARTNAFYRGIYNFQVTGSLNQWASISGNRVKFRNYGIYASNGIFAVISNNTVVAHTTSNSSSRAVFVTGGSTNQVFNNNMVNNEGGYAYYISGNPLYVSNHNNFHSSGTNVIYSGSAHADLASFTAATQFDSMSIEVVNTAMDTLNLRECNDSLNAKGMANPWSVKDFQGHTRDANTPDIGADEFLPISAFTLGPDKVLCTGDTMNLVMNMFDTAIWLNTDTSYTYQVVNPGSYSVKVIDVCGTASDTIAVLAQPQSQLQNTLNLCAGETKTLKPGITGTYTWGGTSSTADSLDVNAAGVYKVTILDAHSCTTKDSVTVTQSAAVNLPDTTMYVCEGNSLTLDAVISGSYLWSDASSTTTQTLNVNASGTYKVTVTDAHNCVSKDSAVVVKVLNPVASFTTSSSAFTVTVNNTSQNGTSYYWDFGDGNSSTQENPGPHVYSFWPENKEYSIKLVVTNRCGSDSVTVKAKTSVGVEELADGSQLDVYPNPVVNDLKLDINTARAQEVGVKILNVNGQQVFERNIGTINGASNVRLDVSGLAKGVYFVNVTLGEEVVVYRILKN